MVAASGNQAIARRNPQFAHDYRQGFFLDGFVIDQTYGITHQTVIYTVDDFFHIAFPYIFFDVQLGIASNFHHVPLDLFITKHAKDEMKMISNQIVQHHDVLFVSVRGQHHKAVQRLGHFDKGVHALVFPRFVLFL